MKQKTIYCCEFCAANQETFYSENPEIVEEHEASHFGLSKEDYAEWKRLVQTAANINRIAGIYKTPQTEAEAKDSIAAMIEFQQAHNIVCERPPSHFYLC